jgi:methyl-accepting chemotaxis protein
MKKKTRKQEKFLKGELCLIWIFILILVFFIFSAVQGYSDLKIRTKYYEATSLDIIDQRIASIIDDINTFPRSASNDILFLSKLFEVMDMTNLEETQKYDLEKLESIFLEFSKENTAYYQLKYIDEFGDEIINLEFDGEEHYVVPDYDLENNVNTVEFMEAMKLNKEEIYISRLDLNIKNDVLENRGTEENPIYIPVIRYATPVFNNDGERKGALISNVYADYFLEEIRRSEREGEQVFLIDNNGYYLANMNKRKEFGFRTGEENNFYKDFSGINSNDLAPNGRDNIETDDFIFTFGYIYPTTSSFEIYKGSSDFFANTSEEDYYWILISASRTDEIKKINNNLKTNYLFSLLFYGLIMLAIIVLIFILKLKIKKGGVKR